MATTIEERAMQARLDARTALRAARQGIEAGVLHLSAAGLDAEPLIAVLDRLSRADEHIGIAIAQL